MEFMHTTRDHGPDGKDEQCLYRPVIVVGGAGHAKVLVSMLFLQRRRVLGFVDLNPGLSSLLGMTHLGDDSVVLFHSPDQVRLVNGVGSIGSTVLHRTIYERFREKNYVFETLIHPSAIIAPEVQIASGVQVMAGALVQPGSCLAENVIINTGARVDHDCCIDSHVHIAPGVTLSGNVHIGSGAHIGTGVNRHPRYRSRSQCSGRGRCGRAPGCASRHHRCGNTRGTLSKAYRPSVIETIV